MGSFTNDLEGKLLDHVFNGAGVAYTPATAIYLCLCTADPGETATGASMNEVANQYGYARTAITFGAAATRRVTQNAAVNFHQASGGGWGTVSHWAIATTNTYGSGDVLAYGAFSASKAVNDGDTPSVASGQVYVEFSAGEISNYLANALLDFAYRNQSYTQPDTYVALCTATIADGDTGSSITEPGSGAYARKQVNDNGGSSPTWNLVSSSLIDNTHDIVFPTATGDWGTMVAVGICDAATVGNLLFYDNDMVDKAVNTDDTAKFPAGDLDITMD